MTRHQPAPRHVRRSPHALIFRNPQETLENRDANIQHEIREAARRNNHLRPVRGPHAMISTPTSTTFHSADSDPSYILDEKATAASVLPAISNGIALFGGSFFRGLLGALASRRRSTSSSTSSIDNSDENSDRGTNGSACGDEPQFQSVDDHCICAFADSGEDEDPFSKINSDPNVMIVVRHSGFRPCPVEGHDFGFSKASTPGAWPEKLKSPTMTAMTAATFFPPLEQDNPDIDLPQPGTMEMATQTMAPIRTLRGPQGLGHCSGGDQEEEQEKEGDDLSQNWTYLIWD